MNPFNRFSGQILRVAEQGFLGDKVLSTEELLKVLMDPNASKSLKLMSTLAFVRGVLPKSLREKFKTKLYDPKNLPVTAETYEFKGTMGAGGQNDVYLLESSDPELPSWVLKISVRKGSNESLTALAHEFQEEARAISERYKSVPGLVSLEHYFVAKSPKINQGNVIASVQGFMGRNLRDIFNEVSREELVEFLKDPEFNEQFVKFSQVTVDTWGREGRVVDIMGKENVAIAEMPDGSARLVVIDPHDIRLEQESGALPEVNRRIAYLEELSSVAADVREKVA